MNDENNKKENSRKENNTEDNNKELNEPKNENSSQSNQENSVPSETKQKQALEEDKYRELSIEEIIEKIDELEEKLNEQNKQIEDLKDLNNQWKDKFARLQAEFENTQKRWEKSRQHLRTQYTANTITNFLSLYDSFKSALKNDEKNGYIEQFYKQFMNIMKSMGAHPMHTEELQDFDYNKHEALSTIERDDLPNNKIIDIVQEGWMFQKEVIRYAKVIISRKPKPPEPEEIKSEEEEEKIEQKEMDSKQIKQEKESPNSSKND